MASRPEASRRRLPTGCPTCGAHAREIRDRIRLYLDLAQTWLYPSPGEPGGVIERRHCAGCQPHRHVASIECAHCADGPLLVGAATNPVRHWLTTHAWRPTPTGWLCPQHS